jgi:hypothetical protein
MRKGLLLPAILLLSLTVLACQKSARQGTGPVPAPQPSQSTAQPQALTSMARPEPAPKKKPQGEPQRASTSPLNPARSITLSKDQQAEPLPGRPRPLTSAATLMALGRQKRALPEDFKIGPLSDDHMENADENGAVSTADAFLAGLVAGKVDRALLAAESEKTMFDTLAYGLKQGYTPGSFRIGTPKVQDDGEIAANVRLFGADGSAEGEIYMARAGKKWLVADLQLSLAQLAVKHEKSKEKYFPSAYRWLLEE